MGSSGVVNLLDAQVSVDIDESEDEWRITLALSVEPALGGRLYQVIAHRIIEIDALVGRLVLRGRTVDIRVPKAIPQSYSSSIGDLIRPLLMERAFSEDLYEYQRKGVSWLLSHPRGILADDMGLGKTAQTICALRRLVRYGKAHWSLVVVPTSLTFNWVSEIRHWAPELVCGVITPDKGDREKVWNRASRTSHVSVTTYEHLRVASDHLSELAPDVLIADEAHRLRNDDSKVSQKFRALESKYTWLLTGTPIENDRQDLAILMSILEPNRFGSPDAHMHDDSLRSRVRPYMLRRTKEDALPELPPVLERHEILELLPSQRAAYNNELTGALKQKDFDRLALFTRLRSICDCDPITGESSKINRIIEIVEDLVQAGEKVVIFSYLLRPLEVLGIELSRCGVKYESVTGKRSKAQRSEALSRFKTEDDKSVLLASMRVTSEGLTLTEAANVIFVNRWWNPSANQQARDRVVRIGQKKTVQVTTLTCRDTVESRISEILENKSITFESLVNSLSEVPELFI